MLLSSFRKKNSNVNSQLSKKNKFQNFISQFRTCSILQNFAEEISLMERCDWSVGQCLQTSNASTMVAFHTEVYFQKWAFERKLSSVNMALTISAA